MAISVIGLISFWRTSVSTANGYFISAARYHRDAVLIIITPFNRGQRPI